MKLNNIDLNKLRVFAVVYENKSISKAASELHLTPSAVSQSLKSLEKEIGVRLFQRVSNRLRPTSTADTIAKLVRKFLSQMTTIIGEGLSLQGEMVGHLKIGAPPEFASQKVVKKIAQICKKSRSSFSFKFHLPDELAEQLYKGEIDIAFADGGSYLKKYKDVLSIEEVFREEITLICSKQFYKKHFSGKKPSFDTLSKLDHIDYRDDGGVLDIWYKYHFGKTPQINVRLVANNVRTIISAVQESMGLAFVPTYLVEKQLKTGQFIAIKIKKTEYANPIYMMKVQDKVPSLLEKKVCESFVLSHPKSYSAR